MIKEELTKQRAFKKEAARLRAEEQKEVRQERALEQKQKQYYVLEKHLQMQRMLEVKKQDVEIQGSAALVKSMESQIKKKEEKKERERL